MLSPTPSERVVASMPNHSGLPEPLDILSKMFRPCTTRADEKGPNVNAPEFDAEPAGEAAAGNTTVCLVTPSPVAISDAEIEVGVPSESPTPWAAGWVGVAPPRDQ